MRNLVPAVGAVIAVMMCAASAFAAQPVKTGAAAFGDWSQDQPGVTRLIRQQDLRAPNPTESTGNFPKLVAMPEGATPLLPQGFSAELVASGLNGPRLIRVAPNGDIFIADSKANQILSYRLKDGKAQPDRAEIFATGLHQPYGIAFYPPGDNPEWIYVANSNSVVRFAYRSGELRASAAPEKIVDYIPETQHWTRDLVFSPDAKTMYLSVGSGSNVALDMFAMPLSKGGLESWKKNQPVGAAWDTEERRADVLSFDPAGGSERIFATGLRNCSGMTLQPANGSLWCVVNERDELGDDTPFEYATRVAEGKFYGWPWYYIDGNEDPRHAGKRPDLKMQVTVPDVLMQAHSAPLGIAFYNGTAFPDEYRGDAFVTLHGSWNRSKRTGYKVVRLLFKNGKPTGEYQDFMAGFVLSDDAVWGRPVGVAVAKDGTLLVTEDGSGTLWRITYTSKSNN